jgi:hypothetical protein
MGGGPEPLASEITDKIVRTLFDRFVTTFSSVHEEIRVEATRVEIRFFFKNEFLCRLAPYRELFHVQVGDAPAWETRVRTEAGFNETMDRALHRFLAVYATSAR